jgi:hypothetical protein
MKSRLWSLAFASCLFISPAMAGLIDFEDLADSTAIGSSYSGLGLTFTNGTVLTAGISLNEFDFPPFSGVNVAFDDGGPITIQFASPVSFVSAYFTYTQQLTFAAFDALNNPLGSVLSTSSNNLGLNELLQLTAPGIQRIVISADPAGTSFTMDDLSFTTETTPVPEPAAFRLLCCGLALGLFVRRGKRLLMSVLPYLCAMFIVAHLHGQQTLEDMTCSPSAIYLNEPTVVTFTVRIPQDPRLISSSPMLIEVDKDGGQAVNSLGSMYDDGSNGDAVAGDNVFSRRVSVTAASTRTRFFRVTVAYRGLIKRVSPAFDRPLYVARRIGDADFQSIVASGGILDLARAHYQVSLNNTGSIYVAQLQTIAWLKQRPQVADAIATTNGIVIRFISGGTALLDTSEPGTLGAGSSGQRRAMRIPGVLLQTVAPTTSLPPTMVVISPFDTELGSQPGNEARRIASLADGAACGPKVTRHFDASATLSTWKSLSGYGSVVVTTHGGVGNVDPNRTVSGDAELVMLTTSEHVALNPAPSIKADYEAGRIGIHKRNSDGASYWGITGLFIDHYYPSGAFTNSFVYLEACSSSYNNTLTKAFLRKGATAVFGYTGLVGVGGGLPNERGVTVFDRLINHRESLQTALTRISNPVCCYNTWEILGSRQLSFGNGYTVTDLGVPTTTEVLAGISCTPLAMNNSRQIVGTCSGGSPLRQYGFIYQPGSGALTPLALPSELSHCSNDYGATDINNNGVAVGDACLGQGGYGVRFLPTPARPLVYCIPNNPNTNCQTNPAAFIMWPFTTARAVNDLGQIAGRMGGSSIYTIFQPSPFITQGLTLNPYTAFPFGVFYDINNSGQTLLSRTNGDFLYLNGSTVQLPGGSARLNDNGIVTGTASIFENGVAKLKAFSFSNSAGTTFLDTLAGQSVTSAAVDINNANEIIGGYGTTPGVIRGSFIAANGTMKDLQSLISSDAGVVDRIDGVYRINDNGEILAIGSRTVNGQTVYANRWVVLTPKACN